MYIRVRGVLASLVIRNRRYIDSDGSPNTVIHRYSTLYILVIISAPYFQTSRIDAWNEIWYKYNSIFVRWIFFDEKLVINNAWKFHLKKIIFEFIFFIQEF